MEEDKNDLTKLLGLDGLTPEELSESLVQMSELLMAAVTRRVVPQLSLGEQSAYEELLDTNAPNEDVYEFLNSHIPDLEKIVSEELETLRTTFKEVMPPLEK